MSDPVIQEIKSRLDVVPFIQGYVKLVKAGVNWKGLCPFHSEKTPSFMVSPVRQTWHCFGCAKGGDVIKFLMEIENLEFRDALKSLAEKAGVQLVREDPRVRSERDRMYAISEEAAKFFEMNLRKTPAVGEYLKKRGIMPETIAGFRLGYAPDSWDALRAHLAEKGFKDEDFARSGLGVKSEKRVNSYYDRFRNRVMFPIADGGGRIVGFSGRTFERGKETNEPKYVNSPQTPIYDKSRVLYGFDKAKDAIRKINRCIVVEGQVDLVMSHQTGMQETVAVSGTALTARHLENLRRLTDTLIASFDTDEAGETATRRSLDLAAEYDFNRKIAVIPKGKDPADAILEDPATWIQAVDGAKSLMEFYFERACMKFNLRTPESKKEFSRYLLPEIAKIANEIEKAHWVSKIAERLGVKEEAVWTELSRHERALDGAGRESIGSRGLLFGISRDGALGGKIQKLEERILGSLFLYPEARDLLKGHDTSRVLAINPHGEILKILEADGPGTDATILLSRVPEEWRVYLDRILFEVEGLFRNIKDVKAEIETCIRAVERERLRERLTFLEGSIRAAEKSGDDSLLGTLLVDFKEAGERLGGL